MENTAPPPGDVAAFEPFAHIADIARYAGDRAELVSVTAVGVTSDGVLPLAADLSARADYMFLAAEGDEPIDARVEIIAPRQFDVSQDMDSGTTKMHLGMRRDPRPANGAVVRDMKGRIAPPPACRAIDLWKRAAAAGVPTAQPATIVYDAKGYELRVLKPSYVSRKFDRACKPVE